MEQMFTPNRIGVYPDGSPVVYSPEKAAEKRREIYEAKKAELEAQGKDASNLRISFAPELEPERYVDRVPRLERSPEADEVMLSKSEQPQMLAAKITPTEAMAWMGVFDTLAAMVQKYGPGIIDFFTDTFGSKPKTPEEAAMKNMVLCSLVEQSGKKSKEVDERAVFIDDNTFYNQMHFDKPYLC